MLFLPVYIPNNEHTNASLTKRERKIANKLFKGCVRILS